MDRPCPYVCVVSTGVFDVHLGLVSIEFETSTEPVQGAWQIQVQLRKEDKPQSRTFKIEEYGKKFGERGGRERER